MEKNTEKKVEVKILKVIYDALMPVFYKLNALVDDVTNEKFVISDIEHATLLEQLSCAISLKVLFEEFFDQAKEADTNFLYLSNSEFINILKMAKTVETSTRMTFSNIGIWSN